VIKLAVQGEQVMWHIWEMRKMCVKLTLWHQTLPVGSIWYDT